MKNNAKCTDSYKSVYLLSTVRAKTVQKMCGSHTTVWVGPSNSLTANQIDPYVGPCIQHYSLMKQYEITVSIDMWHFITSTFLPCYKKPKIHHNEILTTRKGEDYYILSAIFYELYVITICQQLEEIKGRSTSKNMPSTAKLLDNKSLSIRPQPKNHNTWIFSYLMLAMDYEYHIGILQFLKQH